MYKRQNTPSLLKRNVALSMQHESFLKSGTNLTKRISADFLENHDTVSSLNCTSTHLNRVRELHRTEESSRLKPTIALFPRSARHLACQGLPVHIVGFLLPKCPPCHTGEGTPETVHAVDSLPR